MYTDLFKQILKKQKLPNETSYRKAIIVRCNIMDAQKINKDFDNM